MRLQLPLLVTSLDPIVPFSQRCETVVVNCHGGALNSPQAIANATPVLLQLEDGRQAMARVVGCVAAGDKWTVAIKLDRPGNFWNVQPCPEDWLVAGDRATPAPAGTAKPAAAPSTSEPPPPSKLNAWPLAASGSANVGTDAAKSGPPISQQIRTSEPRSAAAQAASKTVAGPAISGRPVSTPKPGETPSQAEPIVELPAGPHPELQQTVQKFRGDLRRLMEENLKVIAAQTEALDEKIQGVAKLKGEIGVWMKVVPELVQEQISKVREEARAEISQELRSIVADNWEQLERQVSELAAKADKLVSSDAEREEAMRKHLEEVIREQVAVAASAHDGEAGHHSSAPAPDITPLQAQVNELVSQLGSLYGLRAELQELRSGMPDMLQQRGTDLQDSIRQAARQESAAALDEFGLGRQFANIETATAERIAKLAEEIRKSTESQLQAATQEVAKQIDSALAGATAPLREETAALARGLAEQEAAGEARFGQFQEEFSRQVKPLLEQATEQARKQLQAALEESVASLRQENSGFAQKIARVDAADEERLARIREEVTHYVEPLVQGAADKARKQFEAALADAVTPVQRQTAAFGERVAAMDEVGRQTSEQLKRIPEMVAVQSDALRRELSAQLGSEIQAHLAELQARADQTAAEQRAQSAAAAALLQEVASARDNLNALLQAAPEKIGALIRESVAAALAAMQGEASNQIRSQLRAEAEELQSSLRRVSEEVSARLHDELAAGLQQRLEGSLREKNMALAAELSQRLEETAKQAAAGIESRLQVLGTSLEQRLSSESAAQQEHWRAAQSAAAAEISALQSQLASQVSEAQSQLTRLQLDWGARGEQIIGEILERAHSGLQETLEFMQKAQLSQARNEIEQALAPILGRAASITNDLRTALASVEREQNLAKVQSGALRQEREELQAWLTQRSGEFHKNLQDALVEATGEVKGRLHLALELMEERMRKTGEESGLRLHGIAEHQANELAARLKSTQEALAASAAEAEFRVKAAQLAHQAVQQELENRLAAGHEELKKKEEEAKHALAQALQFEHTQVLEKFRAAAEQASAGALARWQSEIAEKLRLMQQILSPKTS